MRSCQKNDWDWSGIVIYFEGWDQSLNYFVVHRDVESKRKYKVARMGWQMYEQIKVKTLREAIKIYIASFVEKKPAIILRLVAGKIKIVRGERQWIIPFPVLEKEVLNDR